jgi:hypothetical protein
MVIWRMVIHRRQDVMRRHQRMLRAHMLKAVGEFAVLSFTELDVVLA